MNVMTLILSLGSIGFFASRVFLPAFVTALTLRFGSQIPLVAHYGLSNALHEHPSWFTGTPCLVVLASLSAVEILAQKHGEAAAASPRDRRADQARTCGTEFVRRDRRNRRRVRPAGNPSGGFRKRHHPLACRSRNNLDEQRQAAGHAGRRRPSRRDEPGRLISWLEELWVVFGMFLLILFPIFMLGIIAIAIGLLMLAGWRLAALEESKRIPCVRCQTLIYPCAVACPKCQLPTTSPVAIGFLGQSKDYPAPILPIIRIGLPRKDDVRNAQPSCFPGSPCDHVLRAAIW